MTIKRFKKRGGVDTSSTIPYNDLPAQNNNNNDVDSNDTTSQGSLHLSDLNVSTDSMASGETTNESTESGYLYTHGQGQGQGQNNLGGKRKSKKSKRKSKRKSKKSKRKTKKLKRKSTKSKRKTKKSKRKSRKGGADEADENTSPVPMNEKEADMLNYFK